MNSPMIQLLVLAGIAVFLILRLKNVLGTRDGFEKPPVTDQTSTKRSTGPAFEVIEGGADLDIIDHVPEGSDAAKALAEMKRIEPSFGVNDFLSGARQAYEMIFLAFERGDISEVRGFLDPEVADAFDQVIADRKARGLTVESEIVGVRDVELYRARFDRDAKFAEITVRFLAELTTVVTDDAGEVVEGNATEITRHRHTWTFGRTMGADDPNWLLIATSE